MTWLKEIADHTGSAVLRGWSPPFFCWVPEMGGQRFQSGGRATRGRSPTPEALALHRQLIVGRLTRRFCSVGQESSGA